MRPSRFFVATFVVATPVAFAWSGAGADENAERPNGTAAAPGAEEHAREHASFVDDDLDLQEDEDAAAQAPPPKSAGAWRADLVRGMVRVPGATFKMGSDDEEAPPNERPGRVVVVAPFWMDKTEVTVGAYRACVARGACPRPARSSTSCTYDAGDPALPVSCVPWTSASGYCGFVGKRLPREAEWELAARGTTPIRYPWGGARAGCAAAVTLVSEATQRSCSGKRPARVGSRPAGVSPFGLYDMSGNVEEWVADWYGEPVSELSPRAGSSHVLRGGGWLSPPSQAKTTSRNWGSAREMGPNVGFRCAKDD